MIELLVLVKAYPALSRKYGEVCCVAGVEMTDDGPQWVRLYPVPFRTLDDENRFKKYQRITVRVERHSGDRRPETRRPDRDSIRPVGEPISTSDGWARRRRWVEPLLAESMCQIGRLQRARGTSLAAFRPREVRDIAIEEIDVNAEKAAIAKAFAAQPSLLEGLSGHESRNQLSVIEQIPYRFKYVYRCSDPRCSGHEQSIIDWEISQFYRRVRRRTDWQDRLRARFLSDLCGQDRDTAFIVGNQHQFPASFMVLSVWWPPRRAQQLSLGDLGDR
jgi:hypothetical protein